MTAGNSPDQPPILNSIFAPRHASTARARSASKPMTLLKSLESRKLYGGLSPSWPIRKVFPATLGYLLASAPGAHFVTWAAAGSKPAIIASANAARIPIPAVRQQGCFIAAALLCLKLHRDACAVVAVQWLARNESKLRAMESPDRQPGGKRGGRSMDGIARA